MKKLIYTAVFILALLPFRGFTQNTGSAWPQVKAFHSLMAASFHPTEKGDFKPLKEKADSLYTAAKAWQASTIPAGYKPAETKETLQKLVAQCAAIDKAVKANLSDDKLKKMIAEAHDTFHNIVEKCVIEGN